MITELLNTPEIVLGMFSTIAGFIMKQQAQKLANSQKLMEIAITKNTNDSKLADAAAKRSSPVLRKIVALIIVIICFGGIIAAAWFKWPVSIIEPVEQKEFLFGLFKWGKSHNIITADGLVFPEWVKFSVIQVVAFLFGTGAAKISN